MPTFLRWVLQEFQIILCTMKIIYKFKILKKKNSRLKYGLGMVIVVTRQINLEFGFNVNSMLTHAKY